MSFFNELKRRNVLRVAAAYVVVAWLLIQVTETVFPLFGFDDAPARIVVIVLAIGFIPAVIFAWAFEMTPEGLKKEKDVDRTQSITPQTGKKLDRMIMVVLALALGYFAFDKFVLEPQREATMEEQKVAEVEQALQQGRTEGRIESYGDKSIAVLPFVNMSSDVEQEYFSDGISEELLNLLAKLPELRVISRSSAFSYKGKDIKLAQVAEELNVAHILEGSVRKAGNQVRITAQLIEARSDTHLWSETYDRQLDDIFAIQDEIAGKVVEQLKITLLGNAPQVRETNSEAYVLYLQASHLGRMGSVEAYTQSISLYRQVLAIAPDYAAAWAGLASVYANQANFGLLDRREGFRLAREAAGKALDINPEDARALSRLASIAMFYDNDLAAAARYFEQALRLEPADDANISNAAALLLYLGRTRQAVELQEYATKRDPLNPVRHNNLGTYYFYAGRWDNAIDAYRTVIRLSPRTRQAYYSIGLALVLSDRAEAALQELALEPDEDARLQASTMALYSLGRQQEFERSLAELIERLDDKMPSWIAQVYAWAGNPDAAFAWLDKVAEQSGSDLSGQFLEPYYASIHADPRWAQFLERVGSSPEQLDTIEFEVTLPK